MKILFLGYAVNPSTAENLSGVSIAGNNMQLNLLKNLMENHDIELNVITVYPTAAFPKDEKLFIRREKVNILEGLQSTKISFLNIIIIKQIWQTLAVYHEAKKLINKDTIVFSYNLFPQVGIPLLWLKRKYKCKTISLLADLPIDDKINRKKLSIYFRKIFDSLTRKAISSCDKLIVLNKNAAEIYAPGTEYLIIDGGVDLKEIDEIEELIKTKKNILYSGALTEYSGIVNLIQAMKYIKNQEVYLEIYGTGDLEDYVAECSGKMDNVVFCGRLDNKSMRKMQSKAYLLVNPRPIQDPISLVTFPSKIFEYMISGTPVLTTRLNGFTDEYFDKIYFVESNEPQILAEKINEIIDIPIEELKMKAKSARDFIIEYKGWKVQVAKILRFIDQLSENKHMVNNNNDN